MPDNDARIAYETLLARVNRVAALHRSCAITEGAGRLIWWLGLPLLVATLLQYKAGLPFYIRAPIIPLLGLALIYLAWRLIVRPALARYGTTRAAMLVEEKRPALMSQLVSALEIYSDLQREKPKFDRSLVEAVVIHAQRSTQADDFCAVIDRRPARRQMTAAAAILGIWVLAFVFDAAGLRNSLGSMVTAWNEVNDVIAEAGGARIVIDPLSQPAFLVGSNISIRGSQSGFHSEEMDFHTREDGDADWKSTRISVDSAGHAVEQIASASKTFDCYFSSGRFHSDQLKVVVTERPRVVNLKVQTDLPAYARRAPIIEPRCDGNLKDKLYGSTVTLAIEANKKLKSATMRRSYVKKPDDLVVGAQYARAVIDLSQDNWLADASIQSINETYTLQLTDEYGFTNEDVDHKYEINIVKDRAPTVTMVVPHKSAAEEKHVLEQDLGKLNMMVTANDDWGVAKVTVHYRIENLETNVEKAHDSRTRTFQLPQQDIQRLSLMRMSDTGAQVGDRIVFWAEVDDAYDLEPKKGPHHAVTPKYRIAVVTEEETFKDIVARDTWSPSWYDDLKVATLAARETPARTAPDAEPAGSVSAKLLNAPQMDDGVRADDQQVIQDYFSNLSNVK